jgi:hypothetical protein
MLNRSVHNFAHLRLLAVVVVLAMSLSGGAALASSGGAEAPATHSSSYSKKLKIGSSGKQVAAVQRRLHLKVTWYYDERTARAVKRFQRRHHLQVDGVVGWDTSRALGVNLHESRFPPTGGASSGTGSTVKLPAVLRKIAKCESGGNPRALSPSGRYRGKYQFDLATWRSIGGKGDPAKASEAEQDKRALKLYRKRGTAPWPNCA